MTRYAFRTAIVPATAMLMALSACQQPAETGHATQNAQDQFFSNLSELCGQRFVGQVVTDDPVDDDFRNSRLLMHVRDCSDDEIRIPFWVGDDRSRTWVITRTDTGLRLKHDHRDPDGTAHTLHWYGGDTASEGTITRQEFPVDQESIDLFNANDRAVSTTNVWAVEVNPGDTYVYELARENRLLRVAFDLTNPVSE
ncbi:MAG: hypothetical protein ACK4E3_00450 [Brevundimonas sp.]|uniref:hypothetical protein n=1 Tax=Brevundimonas sp. TaxID=1871086 RepID=UPI0039194D5C